MSSTADETGETFADRGEFVQLGRKMLESIETGLAILEAGALVPFLVNRRMEEWLGQAEANKPWAGAAAFDLPAIVETLQDGETRDLTIEVKARRRPVALQLRVSLQSFKDRRFVIVEAQNISKLKEFEYMMDSYAKMLERNERDLRREKERAEKLLLNIMPRQIYEEIKAIGVTTPQRYDECTVLMLDFVDFTEMSVSRDPSALIAELNDIFTAFDRIVEQYGCERIKTIGDAYIAVSGLPEPAPDHAANIARVALRMLRYLDRRNEGKSDQWRCRIGINAGPLVGSMVGVQKFVYDIFGPGVNLAARLEALSAPMQITLDAATARLLQADFKLEEIGESEIKGFGKRMLYRLVGESRG